MYIILEGGGWRVERLFSPPTIKGKIMNVFYNFG